MDYNIIELNDMQIEDIENRLYEYDKKHIKYEEVGAYENAVDGFSEYFFLKIL